MGDHADDVIFAGIDRGENWSFYRPKYVKRPKTCKTCGKTGLKWQDDGEGWYLAEYVLSENYSYGSYIKHSCKLKNIFKK